MEQVEDAYVLIRTYLNTFIKNAIIDVDDSILRDKLLDI